MNSWFMACLDYEALLEKKKKKKKKKRNLYTTP